MASNSASRSSIRLVGPLEQGPIGSLGRSE